MSIRERAEARGEHDHDHARRNVQEAGLEGREAEKLQVEREEDEEAVQARVDEERLRVRGGEVPLAEEVEGKHRLVDSQLDENEGAEGQRRGDERPPEIAEAAVGPFDEAVGQKAEAGRGERRAGKVEPTGAFRRALLVSRPRAPGRPPRRRAEG